MRSGETKCQVEGQSEVVCCRDRRSVEVLCWAGLCVVRSDEAKEDTQRVRCFSVRRNSEEVQSLPLVLEKSSGRRVMASQCLRKPGSANVLAREC